MLLTKSVHVVVKQMHVECFRSQKREAGTWMGIHRSPAKELAWRHRTSQALATMFQVATRKKRKAGTANRHL